MLGWFIGTLGIYAALYTPAEILGEPNGLHAAILALAAVAIWIPVHRWLTHHDPGPCEETFPPVDFFAPGKHEHRCTHRATKHTSHDCACGMSWQPNPTGLISTTEPLTAEEFAAFKAAWERVYQGNTAYLIDVIDPVTGKETQT
jgi:hypothetical protein